MAEGTFRRRWPPGHLPLGRGAVEHPDKVPGALYGVGKHAVDDPLGTGKQLVGYDELSRGRYEDWLGQMGIGLLTAKTGSLAGRGARLTRVRGKPRLELVGKMPTPINSGKFAGTRVDFSHPDLARRPGTKAPVLATEARRRIREALAKEFPKRVRFTRAGYPSSPPTPKSRYTSKDSPGTTRPTSCVPTPSSTGPHTPRTSPTCTSLPPTCRPSSTPSPSPSRSPKSCTHPANADSTGGASSADEPRRDRDPIPPRSASQRPKPSARR